ncbi:M56 family metallopeptidase [Streptomyces sp. NPDC004682]
MIVLLLLPLAVPWCLPFLARRTVQRVRPERALWTITAATVALAVGSVACLGVLLLPLALTLAPLASLAHLVHPLQAGPRALVLGVSALSAGALTWSACTILRRTVAEAARLRTVRRSVAGLPDAGGLCVLDDPRPDAFALPGGAWRTDRIVVTTGMLRALGPLEREALLAHERAHLAARHHRFLAVAHLAGWCHPALAAVTPYVTLAAERAADETAARHCGNRRLTAQAVGRAALATSHARTHTGLTAGATDGPVPLRVKALLTRAPARTMVPAVLAMALLCSTAGLSSLAGAVWLHHGVEVAQGEEPPG